MISMLARAVLLTVMLAAPALSNPQRYQLDPSHSQILFSYDHLGFSTTYGLFSGFDGEILFDLETPEQSSVRVTLPVRSMFTGWEARFEAFMGPQFFADNADGDVSFDSTDITVTGAQTALITGRLSLNGVVQDVVLETRLNKVGKSPLTGQDWVGFDANTTLQRSAFGLGGYVPFISDDVEVQISVEAMKVDP
ncbi:MAG: YceI family protein [Rhodobacteraceae bacterium]|nr:YceI family protein [Paracoccaceae bacterium]